VRDTLRSEYRKLVTTRSWWVLLLVMALYMVFLGAVMAFAFTLGDAGGTGGATTDLPQGLDAASVATAVYTLAASLGYVFPVLVGALSVTGEARYRTLTPTLLAEPGRTRLVGAKLLASVPLGVLFGIVGVGATVAAGASVLALRGEATLLTDPDMLRTLVRTALALTVWCVVGVGFGCALPNQVVAIVVLLAFTQFVEPLLRVLLVQVDALSGVARFLPGAAGGDQRRVVLLDQRAGRPARPVAGCAGAARLRPGAGRARPDDHLPARHHLTAQAGSRIRAVTASARRVRGSTAARTATASVRSRPASAASSVVAQLASTGSRRPALSTVVASRVIRRSTGSACRSTRPRPTSPRTAALTLLCRSPRPRATSPTDAAGFRSRNRMIWNSVGGSCPSASSTGSACRSAQDRSCSAEPRRSRSSASSRGTVGSLPENIYEFICVSWGRRWRSAQAVPSPLEPSRHA
jgi:ABC-2 type transport system permease protein